MDQISYVAKWTAFGRAIFVEQANLSHPLLLGEDEPACGFGWRHEASDATVAQALLLHATGDEGLAARLGAPFASGVIATLPPAGFRLRRETVLDWVASLRNSWSTPERECERRTRDGVGPRLRLIDGGEPGPDGPDPESPTPRHHQAAADQSRKAA